MKTSRRSFAKIAAAAAIAPAGRLWAGETPLLRAGLMTDTHILETEESCDRIRLAYELFRDIGVDLIANCGDVADHHYPTGYVAYRKTVEDVFSGVPEDRRPKELFVYAGHDVICYNGHPHENDIMMKDTPAAFADMKRLIKATNDPYDEGEIKGFPYVVVPQYYENGKVDWKRVDGMISAAVKSHPGKPVFVFLHVPPNGTTRTGGGVIEKRKTLNRYPQVVNLSGHTHGTLRDERAIWQGEFTSVNIGCLQNWGGRWPGSPAVRKQGYDVALMEVFADRIVFRRFDVRDRKEYSADAPWIVPWPFDPATAPYTRAGRTATAKAPDFAPDAKPEVSMDDPFKTVTISFPSAAGALRPFAYRIEVAKKDEGGNWVPFLRRDACGDFWMRESERPERVTQTIQAACFDAGVEYRVTVSPRNEWNREGREISCTFTAGKPADGGTLVWESSDPMKDCEGKTGSGRSLKAIKPKNGFYEISARTQLFLMMPAGVWDGPKGTKFRFTLDMTSEQEDGKAGWTIVLRHSKPRLNALERISTPPGKCGSMRYMLEFSKSNATCFYNLLVREGGAGRIRFDHVKIERLG